MHLDGHVRTNDLLDVRVGDPNMLAAIIDGNWEVALDASLEQRFEAIRAGDRARVDFRISSHLRSGCASLPLRLRSKSRTSLARSPETHDVAATNFAVERNLAGFKVGPHRLAVVQVLYGEWVGDREFENLTRGVVLGGDEPGWAVDACDSATGGVYAGSRG